MFLRRNYLILFILLLGFSLRQYAALLDPILHEWDEKYHALVAKNMMEHPFKPMLYQHQWFPTDPYNWTFNHVWLHKQPLFLWQMAASMKIFGVSEWAMRLPSVLMGTLMILLLYRIGQLLFRSQFIGLAAALLMAVNNYSLNLISGREGMDHNDVAFCFYVLASFWAYSEYLAQKSIKWALMIGLFAGCAILNKWLTGLIVFAPWGVNAVLECIRTRKLKPCLHPLLALFVCILVFAPWQLYILYHYHDLAMHEYRFNTKHIWESVEGHSGDSWFYLNNFPYYFGWQSNYLVPLGLALMLFNKNVSPSNKRMLSIAPLLVFSFFSFVVATKMMGYFYVMVPICLLLSAQALVKIKEWMSGFAKVGIPIMLALCVYYSLNAKQIINYTQDVNYRKSKIHNTEIYKNLDKVLPKEINIIVNANFQEHVDIMFYSSRIEAYHNEISEADFAKIAGQNIPVAAFKPRPNHPLPDYILRYKNLYLIDLELK